MPSKAKKVDRDVAKLPSIPKELVELFMTGPMTGEMINAAGIAFKTALIEASLNAELSHHLGYAPSSDKPDQLPAGLSRSAPRSEAGRVAAVQCVGQDRQDPAVVGYDDPEPFRAKETVPWRPHFPLRPQRPPISRSPEKRARSSRRFLRCCSACSWSG
jgi:hypothetical protein